MEKFTEMVKNGKSNHLLNVLIEDLKTETDQEMKELGVNALKAMIKLEMMTDRTMVETFIEESKELALDAVIKTLFNEN